MQARFAGVFVCAVLVSAVASAEAPSPGGKEPKAAMTPFRALEERYFVEFLRRNPVTATYLGGDAYRSDLAEVGAGLRDYSAAALRAEDNANVELLGRLGAIPQASLKPDEAVDAAVMRAQIQFVHDLTVVRRHQLKSLDSYMVEPFRGVDWQLQGMTQVGSGAYGTEQEWRRVIQRVEKIPEYLSTARGNLKVGAASGFTPDWRMIEKDGLDTSKANAEYFEKALADLFEQRAKGQTWAGDLLPALRKASASAASAYREFRTFLLETYYTREGAKLLAEGAAPAGSDVFRTHDLLKPEFRRDNFAFGEASYARAVKDYLRVAKAPAALYEEADAQVRATQDLLMAVARRVDAAKGWGFAWGDREKDFASARRVMSRLGEDAPKDDAEMLADYRRKSFDLVEYGRKYKLFDIPEAYRLDVIETPEVLRAGIDGAAYYPAPPFKGTGVGRFYLSPTGNDAAHLRENNRASMADLCAHEGFPGHDWYYQFLSTHMASAGKVRWLTPGAVEDSSSMWEDSMLSEGWALYAEALMAEPPPGSGEAAPDGCYTPEERVYQLQGQLLRDARVRVDVGIHTGRMSFDEAVAYYTANVDFLPGACGRSDPESRASCETATRAIFRYSKWPTQAITYKLGKQEILDLRAEVKEIQGARFDLKAFHEKVLAVGTIPLAYVRSQILGWARGRG
jgi:uncharacterized protein (DUF885 family)